MPALYDYPLLNGNPTSWANLKVSLEVIGGPTFITADFAALDFDETLEPTKVMGTGPQHRGMTVGQYDCNASMSMYLDQGYEFIKALTNAGGGRGFGLVTFDISASYTPYGVEGGVKSVRILGCRVKGTAVKNAPGGDGSVLEMPLAASMLEWIAADGTVMRLV